jgi:hypothetical protein
VTEGAHVRKPITHKRAELIARAHACSHCLEYSFKKVLVRAAPKSVSRELKAAWVVTRICGICGLDSEMGLDVHGDIVYGG